MKKEQGLYCRNYLMSRVNPIVVIYLSGPSVRWAELLFAWAIFSSP